MYFRVSLQTFFECSIARAFKTPLLCDVTNIHTGYGVMPPVTHCEEDKNWGQVGAIKKVFVGKSLTQKGGLGMTDKILQRIENKYWKFEVGNFQFWVVGFDTFVGEWHTVEIEPQKILVKYTYTLHLKSVLFYPLGWVFVHFFWKKYMQRVLHNVQELAYQEAPYLYD